MLPANFLTVSLIRPESCNASVSKVVKRVEKRDISKEESLLEL